MNDAINAVVAELSRRATHVSDGNPLMGAHLEQQILSVEAFKHEGPRDLVRIATARLYRRGGDGGTNESNRNTQR